MPRTTKMDSLDQVNKSLNGVMVTLEKMPSQLLAQRPAEDWTGVTSTAERRKLQNRLNQRAYRQRRNKWRGRSQPTTTSPSSGGEEEIPRKQTDSSPEDVLATMKGHLLTPSAEQRALAYSLLHRIYTNYSLRSPRVSDLQLLITLNVLNAMAHNAAKLGIPSEGLCRDEFISPFNLVGPSSVTQTIEDSTSSLPPPSLRPTALQMKISHHPWIDLIPFPCIRNNFLTALLTYEETGFDEDELCHDMCEVERGTPSDEKPLMIVWGAPWDPMGWEASLPFLRKWGWLIKGCEAEILESTNYWREKRGERRLAF
ncbi:hypothetical protein MKZ38_003690 [Zalerion maritima]|uniref:Uncharacterized protein n=1 Tax=Zalerion maritima TaxID=339359 RepID=A0AAD5RML6_9PEZI|nr:hypothetical protein MKZ38_003690 [Zalerion maritima]